MITGTVKLNPSGVGVTCDESGKPLEPVLSVSGKMSCHSSPKPLVPEYCFRPLADESDGRPSHSRGFVGSAARMPFCTEPVLIASSTPKRADPIPRNFDAPPSLLPAAAAAPFRPLPFPSPPPAPPGPAPVTTMTYIGLALVPSMPVRPPSPSLPLFFRFLYPLY